ncbi:MAG TPA: family 10 glycosylhydrolase [Longimicrobiales bacterium]
MRAAVPLLLAVALAGCASAGNPVFVPSSAGPPPVQREFRGVWVAAVGNIDWPSRPGLPTDSQKAELVRILDRSKQLGLNVVILHVRPAGDALYDSKLEPWSYFLTGEQGRAPDPYYDPLAFAVEQAHQRGLELHAWFNPFRAKSPTQQTGYAPTHIARAHPEAVVPYGSFEWMDPGQDAVRKLSVDVVVDVARRYDVDGVHIDDYFYPYRERGPDGTELDFPDSATYASYRAAGGTLGKSDWRRENVNRYVAEMYQAVKAVKPWVKVGISPIGTWRPNVTPQLRGFDAYESIFADTRKWLVDGDVDYFVPQLYWPIARTDVSFPVLLDWWVKQNVKGRGMYPGLGSGSVSFGRAGRGGWSPDEIIGQIYITRGRPGAEGHVFFPMNSLMPNGAFRAVPGMDTLPPERIDSIRARQAAVQALRDSLTAKLMNETYAQPALVPAEPWLGHHAPDAPHARLLNDVVTINAGNARGVSLWVVQARWSNGWHTDIVPIAQRQWTLTAPNGVTGGPSEVWVATVDRVGNMSKVVRAR